MFNILFAGLNLAFFYLNQNGNIYVRCLNLTCCLICSLNAIIDVINKKEFIVEKNIVEKSGIKIEKHGTYYYTETCPICGCIFSFDPHELGFLMKKKNNKEIRKEWIYCPECAYKFEWDENFHKKLNY